MITLPFALALGEGAAAMYSVSSLALSVEYSSDSISFGSPSTFFLLEETVLQTILEMRARIPIVFQFCFTKSRVL